MSISGADAAFLVGAGALAGVAGTAGGIASLVSYPALLVVGLGPLPANVTNLVALLTVGAGSTLASRPELTGQRAALRRWAPICAVGGTLGGVLLLVTPSAVFDWVVPFLVAGAALVMLAQPRITAWHASRARPHTQTILILIVLGISIYSSYFGAGSGIMMLAAFLVLGRQELSRANALKNTLTPITNVIPAAIFAAEGRVVWVAAIALAAGAFVGGTFGPRIVRRSPERQLRYLICACGLALTGWLLANAVG
ncbi:MAG TPA: sulfite exporter TauE/SafE family protein [Solirubrobacteraceae bacterium]|nr:sulfite exporter TauE/SafE family protein [Solirubrobacteraceae bacterium]